MPRRSFGWVNFGEVRKRRREKMEDKTNFVGVWLERGEEKKLVGPRFFLFGPTKILFPQFGAKIDRRK